MQFMNRQEEPTPASTLETQALMQMKKQRNTEPHPAASYFPGKCHRTPDPADERQENMVPLHTSDAVPTNNPKPEPTTPTIYVACSIERTRTGPRGTATGPELVTIDSLQDL